MVHNIDEENMNIHLHWVDTILQVLREILGESLFYPSREQRPPLQFESPEVLKGFIIVSDQPPSDTIEDQVCIPLFWHFYLFIYINCGCGSVYGRSRNLNTARVEFN